MFMQKTYFNIVIIFYFITSVFIECGVITPREMEIRRTHQLDLKKRPFCNAFTGCGKKRSEIQSYAGNNNNINNNDDDDNNNNNNNNNQNDDIDNNSLSDLIDINSEPAVQDIMRQIMSQAKLWEAIQEANKEISQKNGIYEQQNRFPISFSSQ